MYFREFSKAYNDYLCHGQGNGSSMKYGSKEYRKSGRRVYGSEAANMRPKDYIAKCVRQGMTNEEIIKQCESALDPRYNPTTDEKHFFMEIIRLVKNDIQHSYTNDFRELHEDYLMHFGILGMKWGIRRYQNPDGTLTQAGKKRYDKLNAKADKEDKVVEVFKNEKPGLLISNPGYNAKILAEKKSKKLRESAAKYGTETPEERQKRVQDELKKAKVRNDERRKEADKIDLWEVRNTHFKTDEDHDKWEEAMDDDKYELDFLEAVQNDWFEEEDTSGARKARLKEYADYLDDREKYMSTHRSNGN